MFSEKQKKKIFKNIQRLEVKYVEKTRQVQPCNRLKGCYALDMHGKITKDDSIIGDIYT